MDYKEIPVWLVLVLVILFCLAGLLIGSAIGLAISALIYTGEGNLLEEMSNPSNDKMRVPLLVTQALSAIMGFLIFPFFIRKLFRKKDTSFFQQYPLHVGSLLLVLFLVISFVVVDSAIIEWNQNIQFPDFLKSFEAWSRGKEDELALLTKMLTTFDSFGEFVIGFIVIAV